MKTDRGKKINVLTIGSVQNGGAWVGDVQVGWKELRQTGVAVWERRRGGMRAV